MMDFLRHWLPVAQFLNLAALPGFIFSTFHYRRKSKARSKVISMMPVLFFTDIDFRKIDELTLSVEHNKVTAKVYRGHDVIPLKQFKSTHLQDMSLQLSTYINSLTEKQTT